MCVNVYKCIYNKVILFTVIISLGLNSYLS